MSESWVTVGRPGYFGRRRDEKVAGYDAKYGKGNWRLAWRRADSREGMAFVEACVHFYEKSYLDYLSKRPDDIDFICSFGECIDNALSNIQSGTYYGNQESYSTHIQDIAIRNVLAHLGRKFEGPPTQILIIRSSDTNGFRFGPGNIPFFDRDMILEPSLCPSWAKRGSVEDFWQSNKFLERKQ